MMYADGRTDQAARHVFALLRIGFAAAPVLFGVDKFFNWSVHWPHYLAPWINDIIPGSAQQFIYAVGVVEIVAGLAVAVVPRFGAPLVSAWLFGIIALRDFGLLLGSLALTRLAWAIHASGSAPANISAASSSSAIRV